MWFKIDDQFPFHSKADRAGNQAIGVWARAGAWSGQQLTDGYIPDGIVKALGATRSDTTRLIQAGLWHKVPGGYQFHDWEKYQPSAVSVREKREKERERLRKLRANAEKNTPGNN